MANLNYPNLTNEELTSSFSFSNFPEDVQLCILSFLTPSEVANFACTSKRFNSLCRNSGKLWFALCDRRFGSKTQIKKWGNGKVTCRQLYKTLDEYENLIGFWRRSGQSKNAGVVNSSPLVFFEWGPSFVTGSRVSPSKSGMYQVMKAPFLWLSITPKGAPMSFLDPECRFELADDLVKSGDWGLLEGKLVPVNVSFVDKSLVVVEENLSFAYPKSPEGRNKGLRRVSSSGNLWEKENRDMENVSGTPGSLPDRLVSDIYQYFANRTSPGSDGALRRQRKREKERQGKRKWEPEHLVKVDNCSPTPSRPLQGLWKGICDDMNLDFYLVAYDDVGGITCRKVVELCESFSGHSPVFSAPRPVFINSPFSPEEEYLYDSRIHLQPSAAADSIHEQLLWMENEVVSRILYISSSYEIPNLVGASANPRHVEGRVWQYGDGTFGFGFLHNSYIIDLKHIAQDGCILDIMELCTDILA